MYVCKFNKNTHMYVWICAGQTRAFTAYTHEHIYWRKKTGKNFSFAMWRSKNIGKTINFLLLLNYNALGE